MNDFKIKVPIWFWVVTIILVLWNLMGVLSFFMHTFMPEDALAVMSEQERKLYTSYPIWGALLFAIAVFCGLIGSFGLVLKKRWSKLVFIISLCAMVPQMIHNVFFTESIEVYGIQQAVTMPSIVIAIGLFVVWFSSLGIKKNWLK